MSQSTVSLIFPVNYLNLQEQVPAVRSEALDVMGLVRYSRAVLIRRVNRSFKTTKLVLLCERMRRWVFLWVRPSFWWGLVELYVGQENFGPCLHWKLNTILQPSPGGGKGEELGQGRSDADVSGVSNACFTLALWWQLLSPSPDFKDVERKGWAFVVENAKFHWVYWPC